MPVFYLITQMLIYHITHRCAWTNACKTGVYSPETLITEGFIHCSKKDQVCDSAGRHFSGQSGLVLLCIESSLVESETRHENLAGGDQLFPHIYGPLNVNAVLKVLDFEPDSLGKFCLPEGIR